MQMEITTGTVVALLMAIPVLTKTVDKLVDGVLNRRKNNKTNGCLKSLSDNQLKISLTLKQINDTMIDMKEDHHRDLNGATDRIVDKIDDSVVHRLEDIKDKLKA